MEITSRLFVSRLDHLAKSETGIECIIEPENRLLKAHLFFAPELHRYTPARPAKITAPGTSLDVPIFCLI